MNDLGLITTIYRYLEKSFWSCNSKTQFIFFVNIKGNCSEIARLKEEIVHFAKFV